MASNNKDRISEALDLLRSALAPVVERVMATHLGAGQDWTELLRAVDARNNQRAEQWSYNREDIKNLLRVATIKLPAGVDYPFTQFGQVETNLLREASQIRNAWAHDSKISSDDTLRALDTVERLLAVLGAPEQAKHVRSSRMDLNRRVYEEQTRSDTRNAVADLADDELRAWHEVLEPHPDVLSGRFKESEFAANLYSVALGKGDAGREYSDPVEFFRRTYLTEGLEDLLRQAAGRTSGASEGAPVINLQTTFGGGKTHSMLAVWHLFDSTTNLADLPDDVADIARSIGLVKTPVARAAIVGNEIAPGQPSTKVDGTTVNTLWGEIAWQLGGRSGFALVAEADRTGTNPGAALRELLARYSPCVILVDEWVAYARQLHERVDLPGGTFETQFTFAQALTEAASQTPGALVLVSIPASDARNGNDDGPVNDLETGGEHGREALQRLEHVVGRTAHQWQPATSRESFEIVRRRLFSTPDDAAARGIAATARKFVQYYRSNAADLPSRTQEGSYEERIRRAFPIHPELFDRLYEDWSTLERFQRTRGVLRLMSTVIKALVDTGDHSPLIMPGTVPVGIPAVTSEFMQYVEPSWRAVIDTDVDGQGSNSHEIDRERPLLGARSVTTRLARALFIASGATSGSIHKGAATSELYLGVAMPGDVLGNFHSALSLFEDRSTYVFHDAVRHWLDVSPSLNRTARDRANALDDSTVDAEIVRRLRTSTLDSGRLFQNVVVAPTDGAEVSEDDETRLVILGPQATHKAKADRSVALETVSEISLRRGHTGREFRNTLLFLAPDATGIEMLRVSVREYLAWNGIVVDRAALDLRHEQEVTARRRSDEENDKVERQLRSAWIWALAPRQMDGTSPDIKISASKTHDAEDRLTVRASRKFNDNDELRSQTYAPLLIRRSLDQWLHRVWNSGHVSVEELWQLHAKYLYLPRLRSRAVLIEGVSSVMQEVAGGAATFWLADAYNEETGDYQGLAEPLVNPMEAVRVTPTTLLVRPEIGEKQRERERERAGREAATSGVAGGNAAGGLGTSTTPAGGNTQTAPGGSESNGARNSAITAIKNAAFEGIVSLDPAGDLTGDLQAVAEEIIAILRSGGADILNLTVSIEARKAQGFDERTVRNVRENARLLDFERVDFRDYR